MNKSTILGIAVVSASLGAVAHAAQISVAAKPVAARTSIRVVAGARALSVADKSSVGGECGCDVAYKPGYGFGAPVEHYGPPGQGFTGDWTWRDQLGHWTTTPKGNEMPPVAPGFAASHPFE